MWCILIKSRTTTISTKIMKLKLFSGTSNVGLSELIYKQISSTLYGTFNGDIKNDIFHHTFPSGEKYCQYKQNIRGDDVFLIQSPSVENTNDAFMELLIMIDAAKRASASRITAVLPMAFYTRQDRKDKSRVPISSRLCLDLLEKSGADRILSMDLHADQIVGFTNLPFDQLLFDPVLIKYIQSKEMLNSNNTCMMAPDVGALKRVERYVKKLNCEFGFISKRRINDDTVELQSIIGNVKDKNVILIDDLTESFGTLRQSAIACKQTGATSITCVVTHGCLTRIGCERLTSCFDDNIIDEFIFSNTIENKYLNDMLKDSIYKDRLTQLSVSDLFASAIINTHINNSISGLF
jgi:ribose-phosphate pyrophosphokinase